MNLSDIHKIAILAANVQMPTPSPYGPELLVDGDFATDPGPWDLTSGDAPLTISGGQLHGPGVDSGVALQTISSQEAATYHLVYTIVSIIVGTVGASLGGGIVGSTDRTTVGTFIEDLVAPSSFTTFQFNMILDCDAVVDNVSLKKVL